MDLATLYAVADDSEVAVLDTLAYRSGALWLCHFCHWNNLAANLACESCSRSHADSATADGDTYQIVDSASISLYDTADDYEASALDHLREKAGLMWTCFCRWFNLTSNLECENCGRSRAQSQIDEEAIA